MFSFTESVGFALRTVYHRIWTGRAKKNRCKLSPTRLSLSQAVNPAEGSLNSLAGGRRVRVGQDQELEPWRSAAWYPRRRPCLPVCVCVFVRFERSAWAIHKRVGPSSSTSLSASPAAILNSYAGRPRRRVFCSVLGSLLLLLTPARHALACCFAIFKCTAARISCTL